MREKKDIGLSYLRQLDMNPPKESKLLYFQFSSKYGETVGRRMLSIFTGRFGNLKKMQIISVNFTR
ncbi:MAG: hypothetical protein V8R85_07965 [Frisingicoccus sp.]